MLLSSMQRFGNAIWSELKHDYLHIAYLFPGAANAFQVTEHYQLILRSLCLSASIILGSVLTNLLTT